MAQILVHVFVFHPNAVLDKSSADQSHWRLMSPWNASHSTAVFLLSPWDHFLCNTSESGEKKRTPEPQVVLLRDCVSERRRECEQRANEVQRARRPCFRNMISQWHFRAVIFCLKRISSKPLKRGLSPGTKYRERETERGSESEQRDTWVTSLLWYYNQIDRRFFVLVRPGSALVFYPRRWNRWPLCRTFSTFPENRKKWELMRSHKWQRLNGVGLQEPCT